MAKEKSIVEEAIIQMKNLEEAVAENAKGILASTMKEEIKELVKESLSEQEEEEVEDEENVDINSDETGDIATMDMGDTESEDDIEDEEGDEEEMEDEEDEEEAIDLTDKSDAEVLRVFKLMGPDDNIVVTKDDAGNISIKDDEKEYMIVGESVEEMDEEELDEMYDDSNLDEEMDFMDDDFSKEDQEEFTDELKGIFKDEMDENIYELEMDDIADDEFSGDAEVGEEESIVYEIEFNESDELEEEEEEEFFEEDESLMESKKMKIKAKGVGMGSPKFKYNSKPNMSGGFKEKMKQGPKSVGTGKAKFEYKEGENMNGKMKPVKKEAKKVETKEASRTLGNGSNFRKGGLPKRRAHSSANTSIKENFDFKEVELLREKNEEYRKALNVFRNKLNEVAVFNSNLAYATRLFTEHSTSKQEKINILRRFDGVETIKESKNLYQTIKDELSVTTSKGKSNVNESVERVIEKSQSTGSATNLIESKTYENPQFLRMKDLMAKIK